jgi:hypothetical protein
MVELAWMWLRHQPGSSLSAWFRERVGPLKGRIRRITVVAVTRKLLITLWRYLEVCCQRLLRRGQSTLRHPSPEGQRRRSLGVSPTAFIAHPPDLQRRSLMDMDFATGCPLVRPSPAPYPIAVRQVAILLDASFRRALAEPPLRIASASQGTCTPER